MRLIEQATLYTKLGGGVQLYQVDVCETGTNEFVVNYRWGKLDSAYTDSTRTVFPVGLDEAQRIFQSLVQEKLASGYVDSPDKLQGMEADGRGTDKSKAQPHEAELKPIKPNTAQTPRVEAILGHLSLAAEGEKPKSSWKLSRIIWRAGELRIYAAIPYLLRIGLKKERFHDYALLWSLARLASEDAVPLLKTVFDAEQFPDNEVQRVAAEGLLRCSPANERSAFCGIILKLLPTRLRELLPTGTAEQIAVCLAETSQRSTTPCVHIYLLSLLTEEYSAVRRALVLFCRQAPLRPNFFKPIRWVFKSAELREDAELLATLTYRFETTPAYYRRGTWGDYANYEGGFIRNATKETAKPNSRLAYSDRTRNAFRKRAARFLHRAGDNDSSEYVSMATAMLLQFDDEVDAGKPYNTLNYRWDSNYRNSITITTAYDTHAGYLALNQILYTNSTRYTPNGNRTKWKCSDGYSPGQPVPENREEAFPHLWDQAPSEIILLLSQSRCGRVHVMAVRVFRANMQAFAARVKISDLVAWFSRKSSLTQELAIDVCEAKHNPENPSLEISLAMLDCELERARALALSWVKLSPDKFLSDSLFLAKLLCSHHEDVHLAAKSLLASAEMDHGVWDVALARAVAILIEGQHGDSQDVWISQVNDLLCAVAAPAIARLPFRVIEDLLGQDLPAYHALAASFLALRKEGPSTYPSGVLTSLIESSSPVARRIGTELFGRFSDEELAARQNIVASLCLSRHSEIREAVQVIVARLVANYPELGAELLERFYPLLLRKESASGIHEDLLRLIQAHLSDFLDRIPADYALRMLRCPYLAGKELGWAVLQCSGGLERLSMRERVSLGNNDIFRVRTAVCEWFQNNQNQVIEELPEAVRLVDAGWADTQTFAMGFFRDNIAEQQWTPEVLVSLCDSNDAKVQAFGTELITRFFKTDDGPRYLLQLSQHPAASMQIFAVNYLEKYASGDVARLAELESFFVTLLALINQGRIAKIRVFAFLKREGEGSPEAASIVMRILARHSATVSVLDKAACIEIMSVLQSKYGAMDSPLNLLEPKPVA